MSSKITIYQVIPVEIEVPDNVFFKSSSYWLAVYNEFRAVSIFSVSDDYISLRYSSYAESNKIDQEQASEKITEEEFNQKFNEVMNLINPCPVLQTI